MTEKLLSLFRYFLSSRYRYVTVIILYVYTTAFITLFLLMELPSKWVYAAIGVFVGISILLAPQLLRTPLPVAYSVAVLGFKKSGKTTLLTQMFNELLLFRIDGVRARLRGEETINRISDYIAKIKARMPVGPTDTEKRFPYTANVDIGTRLFQKRYKVTFGDYPGEESERFSDFSKESEFQNNRKAYQPLLASSEFFRWVLECDSIVFVVDVARYLQEKYRRNESINKKGKELGYVLEMTKSVMSDWHHIMEARERGSPTRQPRVIIAFTKADLFDVEAKVSRDETIEKRITLLGFEPPLPEVREVDKERYLKGAKECKESFGDLITFLSGNAKSFEEVITSSFGLLNGRRIGIQELFEAAIPR